MTQDAIGFSCPCESGLAYTACCGISQEQLDNGGSDIVDIEGSGESSRLPKINAAIKQINALPDLYPTSIKFNSNEVLWTKMSPTWYDESVFLDAHRIIGRYRLRSSCDWLQKQTQQISVRPSAYIFHTAFCGSTLMSKALGSLYNTLPLREPDALGNLLGVVQNPQMDAAKQGEWVDRVCGLLTRRYDENAVTVIKANDYSNPMMSVLSERYSHSPQLFMYTPLNEFLAGCMKAPNRQDWIRDRCRYVSSAASAVLNDFDIAAIGEDDYGKMAAVYWSYNVALFLEAQQNRPEQFRSLLFSDFIEDPVNTVTACANHFQLLPYRSINIASELQSLFGVYSKGQHPYSPQQRLQEIMNVLENNQSQAKDADLLARVLLGDRYPETRLPSSVVPPVEEKNSLRKGWFRKVFSSISTR